jgi:hypothetical protein
MLRCQHCTTLCSAAIAITSHHHCTHGGLGYLVPSLALLPLSPLPLIHAWAITLFLSPCPSCPPLLLYDGAVACVPNQSLTQINRPPTLCMPSSRRRRGVRGRSHSASTTPIPVMRRGWVKQRSARQRRKRGRRKTYHRSQRGPGTPLPCTSLSMTSPLRPSFPVIMTHRCWVLPHS